MVTSLLALAGCGTAVDPGATTVSVREDAPPASETLPTLEEGTGPDVVVAEGVEYDDFGDPANWATWGSYAAYVTVEAERKVSVPLVQGAGEEEDFHDGTIHRDLDLRVEQVVWEHPGAITLLADGASVTVRTYGWQTLRNGRVVPFAYDGQERMEIGGRYLVILSDGLVDGEQVLGPLRAFTVEGTVVDSAGAPVDGMDVAAVTDLLDRQPIDPDLGPRPGEDLGVRILRTGEGWLG